ncbi:MAG: GNAT family N-acetyltransferase [Calditrichaeota bacterium]|nr:GNAT family N-acetyltransferase [Calditrichota bacterium]
MRDKINWIAKRIDQLNPRDLLDLLRLRQDIFIIEQRCIYPDIDSYDYLAVHFIGRRKTDDQLIAYSRLLPGNSKYEYPSIGRIVIAKEVRGQKLGQFLINESINYCQKLYPESAISIGAQLELETYYQQFGFKRCSEPYDDDGILHIDMILIPTL